MAITKLIADSITSGAIASTPSFFAQTSANANLKRGTETLAPFNTEIFDTNSVYNNTSGNYKFTDTTQGYRAYSKKVLTDSKIGLMNKKFKRYQLLLCATTLIPKYNYKCIEVPNTRTYSIEGGQTKFNFSNLVLYFLDILNYSLRIKFKK